MSSAPKVTAFIDGVARFQRSLELMDEGTRRRTVAAVREGAIHVERGAELRVPKVSGELAYTIRSEFTKDGMVAWVKAGYGKLLRRSRATTGKNQAKTAAARERAKARSDNNDKRRALAMSSRAAAAATDLGIYSAVVEHGDKRRNKPKRPFLMPSFVTEKPNILANLAKAPQAAAKEAGLT